MKTTISIINANDKKIVVNAIEKANSTHNWEIKVKFTKSLIDNIEYEFAEITTEETEQLLYIGMYMGRLGF